MLSEEGADDLARLDADRAWIVDPLDGTREFSEPPRDDWAIHVALWERGAGDGSSVGELTAGAVALPAKDLVLATYDVPALAPCAKRPSSLHGEPYSAACGSRTGRGGVRGRTGPDGLGREPRPWPSFWVTVTPMSIPVASMSGIVPHQWQLRERLACSAVGSTGVLWCTTSGTPLLPDLVICRPELANDVLAALA